MPKLPVVSGQDLVRVLTKAGFEVHHQKGSHIILKQTASPCARLSVPNHKELKDVHHRVNRRALDRSGISG